MVIGVAREIKQDEYRVGLTPASSKEYLRNGHTVFVESGAGEGSGFSDQKYVDAGCIIAEKKELFERAGMIIKVKEPLEEEYNFFREEQILYTYLHLAANKELAKVLLEKKIYGVAYETVMEEDGTLPLLKPMSEIAGRLSVQEGAKYLEKPFGGRGILLGGVPGIARGKITILGGGVVGTNACKIAVGIGAEVTILDLSARRLGYLDDIFGSAITTLYSNDANIEESVAGADLVIGAVLIPGAAAPKLIRKEHLKTMKQGAVIVDVAVDQGGCVETIHPTYHNEPIYIIDGIVHYGVANMPGVVALSSTNSLTSVTSRYGLQIADSGLDKALEQSAPLRHGLNLYAGKLTNKAVAEATSLEYSEL
ncbi:MAG: alanine dehydrogenase [Spirochaetales bacterium]|nr:alanine dehydrogenase [Spirochaetales bacterium]